MHDREDGPTPDEERERREAEELESFRRRSDWWQEHYGVPAEEADERTREAREHADAMPTSDEAEGDDERNGDGRAP